VKDLEDKGLAELAKLERRVVRSYAMGRISLGKHDRLRKHLRAVRTIILEED
jgi:hypothetical protein